MDNGPCTYVLPIKMVIFHSYVSLPEGTCSHPQIDGKVNRHQISRGLMFPSIW